MGLLDDLLGQLAGAQAPQPQAPASRAGAAGGPDMTRVLMALMPVVLAMLGNRRGEPASGYGQSAGAGGGLGGVLGQVLGAAVGGGGLGGLLEQFQRAGYGEQASSWVSRGQNLPIDPGALAQVFGQGGLAEIARRAGLSEEDTSRGLARLMPEVVDHVTPNGSVSDGSELLASVDALARRLGV